MISRGCLWGFVGWMILGANVQAETLRIYAAASLREALQEITTRYQAQRPNTEIKNVFAGSSLLAKQIEAGANSDIFISADRDWMQYLVQRKQINAQQVHPLLSNQLVLIGQKHLNMPFQASAQFNIAQAFKGKLCTGQLQSVPAGKYAQQSLSYFKWFASVQSRIVQSLDVRAALVLVERGECELGIVYKTDALVSNKVKIIGTFPTYSHQAIVYPIALTRLGQSRPEAQQLVTFIRSNPQAKAIFQQHGFTVF